MAENGYLNGISPCLHFSFFIIHFSLFIFHYSLFIFHYSLFIIHYSFLIVHYLPSFRGEKKKKKKLKNFQTSCIFLLTDKKN
jgi:hypothetical protein